MELIEKIRTQAKQKIKLIVFPEGKEERVIKAAHIVAEGKMAKPILLGNVNSILNIAPCL